VNNSLHATLNLLNTSSVVAIAGSLRLYVALLFAGIAPLPFLVIGEGLVVYSTYLFDRALSCEEDAINRKEIAGANKRVGLLASVIAFGTGAGIFCLYGHTWLHFFRSLSGISIRKESPLEKKSSN
jgi:hypothetical protein